MAESMVDCVAKALFCALMPDTYDDEAVWHRSGNEATRDFYRELARIMIEVMREPTPEMVHAGMLAHTAASNQFDDLELSIWHAMVDAALSQGEPQ